MKKIVIAAAVAGLTVLSAAAPALAQPHGPPRAVAPQGWELDRRLDWMQQRIDRGRADGSLDRREARRVQSEIIRIRQDGVVAKVLAGKGESLSVDQAIVEFE